MSSCTTSDFKMKTAFCLMHTKTDIDPSSNLAVFAVSSIVSDKAEPAKDCMRIYPV